MLSVGVLYGYFIGTEGHATRALGFGVFGGGVEQSQVHTDRKLSNNDVGSASGGGFIRVTSVPFDIDLRASHDNGGSVNMTVESASLIVKKIGV